MLALFYSNIYKLGNLARKITEVISPISKATWLWIIFKPSHQILLINRVGQKCDSILQLLIGSSVTAAVRSKLELGSFCAAPSSSDIRFIWCHPRCTASTYIAEPRISLCTSAADNNVKNWRYSALLVIITWRTEDTLHPCTSAVENWRTEDERDLCGADSCRCCRCCSRRHQRHGPGPGELWLVESCSNTHLWLVSWWSSRCSTTGTSWTSSPTASWASVSNTY